MITPRFDSPVYAVLNLVGIAVSVYVAGRWIQARRSGRRARWIDLMILFHVSLAGVYIPLFPLLWLKELRRESAESAAEAVVQQPKPG